MAVVKEEEEIVQEEVSLGALNLARLVGCWWMCAVPPHVMLMVWMLYKNDAKKCFGCTNATWMVGVYAKRGCGGFNVSGSFCRCVGFVSSKVAKKQSAYLQTTDQPFGRGVWELYIS